MLTVASIQFIVALLVTALLYSLAAKGIKPWFLLLASLAFYGSFNWYFLFLLIGVIGITYSAGLAIHRYRKARGQVLLWTAAVLSPLLFYKYLIVWFPGLWESIIPVSGFDLEGYGKVLIPVGLSFFTFQCLGYVFDIHRGYYEPERHPARFSLFVAFFPQLLAGPIERWPNLSRQLTEAGRPSPEMVLDGLQLLAYGFFMKHILADWLAFYVDAAFVDPAANSSAASFIGLYGFPIQLYADFCGYSLIALGSARLFGVKLTMNFRQPFFARSIEEFWQRWHISLTRWVGDYLYRPLALRMIRYKGLSKGVQEGCVLFVTWVVIGMWHGALWTFFVFGLCMALLFVIHSMGKRRRRGRPPLWRSALAMLVTFHLIVLTFPLIRAGTIGDYLDLVTSAFAFLPGHIPFTGAFLNVVFSLAVVVCVDMVRRLYPDFRFRGLYTRIALVGIMIVLVMVMGHDEGKTIIYFGF